MRPHRPRAFRVWRLRVEVRWLSREQVQWWRSVEFIARELRRLAP